MRLKHFHALRPICLVCRQSEPERESPLEISHAIREAEDDVLEGLLRCSVTSCQYEYPIIDGIPFLVSNPRDFLAKTFEAVRARDDLSATIMSVLGDCSGPGSNLDIERRHLSSYGWCHFGDLDPEESDSDAGSSVTVLRALEAQTNAVSNGPVIDLGCSVGRTSLELTAARDQLVLGVDVNVSMLRLASRVLRSGIVRYPRRRVGLAYDAREFPVEFSSSENVDFWACDASALPFADGRFARTLSLNTLDSVPSPVGLLESASRVTAKRGVIQLACPYDWSEGVTPVEAWIGGHSQRAAHEGSSKEVLLALLRDETSDLGRQLRVVSQSDGLSWVVRLHDRSKMQYSLHGLTLERI